ncbi:BBE domain-containing protein [Cardinium endosymbiont of Oedothorax gibbosus]|uniref:BBE domain-containing protein n=1 Tax=Cardinium endosymbiont of Oedothorax gibbosus TaxID=931101 RepID=UPI002024D3E0|nr:BBE domain-containing protein [Cardinium endosymbiont of Oedothorax gibbosus]
MLSLDFNAFAHRDAIASIQILAYWQNEAKKHMQLKWSKQYYLALKKFGKGVYRNYPDLWLNDWGREYYGNNWGRLKQNNLFNYEQSILAK